MAHIHARDDIYICLKHKDELQLSEGLSRLVQVNKDSLVLAHTVLRSEGFICPTFARFLICSGM
jgi:hypothetical protein